MNSLWYDSQSIFNRLRLHLIQKKDSFQFRKYLRDSNFINAFMEILDKARYTNCMTAAQQQVKNWLLNYQKMCDQSFPAIIFWNHLHLLLSDNSDEVSSDYSDHPPLSYLPASGLQDQKRSYSSDVIPDFGSMQKTPDYQTNLPTTPSSPSHPSLDYVEIPQDNHITRLARLRSKRTQSDQMFHKNDEIRTTSQTFNNNDLPFRSRQTSIDTTEQSIPFREQIVHPSSDSYPSPLAYLNMSSPSNSAIEPPRQPEPEITAPPPASKYPVGYSPPKPESSAHRPTPSDPLYPPFGSPQRSIPSQTALPVFAELPPHSTNAKQDKLACPHSVPSRCSSSENLPPFRSDIPPVRPLSAVDTSESKSSFIPTDRSKKTSSQQDLPVGTPSQTNLLAQSLTCHRWWETESVLESLRLRIHKGDTSVRQIIYLNSFKERFIEVLITASNENDFKEAVQKVKEWLDNHENKFQLPYTASKIWYYLQPILEVKKNYMELQLFVDT
jgi:hypothetical protein